MRTLVKKIAENTKIPYFSVTPTFSICPIHGYVRGEHFNCPFETNGKRDGEVEVSDKINN